MSQQTPRSLEEWRDYFESLDEEELWSKAGAANSAAFVKDLLKENYEGEEIEEIFKALATRFKTIGQRPPGGGYFNLAKLGGF